MIEAPKVSTYAEATAMVLNAQQRHYVAHLERIADGPPHQATAVAFKPEIGSIRDGYHAILSGRASTKGFWSTPRSTKPA